MSGEYKETRIDWHGATAMMHRSTPMWDDTKVMVSVRMGAWHMPGSASEFAALFATFPADAQVTISEDENPGEVEVGWIEDATPEDIAEYRAGEAAARQAEEERAAFEAWKANRAAAEATA